MKIKEP